MTTHPRSDLPPPFQRPPAKKEDRDNGNGVAASMAQLKRALVEYAPVAADMEARLRAATTSSAAHPGKLVRGRLLKATAHALQVNEACATSLAVAVEYFHLASLLLDDLPCMDDAQMRRGRPCVHRVHGESTAILTALAFINRAYALAGFALAPWPSAVRCQAHAALDACLGVNGLTGGQARDLNYAVTQPNAREAAAIARAKTTPLLLLAALLPALAGGAHPAEVRELRALTLYWGLAFQALDDLGDLLITSTIAGKTTGRDRALDRPNLALALGVPATRRRLSRLIAQAARRILRLTASRPVWSFLSEFHQDLARAAAPMAEGQVAVAA